MKGLLREQMHFALIKSVYPKVINIINSRLVPYKTEQCVSGEIRPQLIFRQQDLTGGKQVADVLTLHLLVDLCYNGITESQNPLWDNREIRVKNADTQPILKTRTLWILQRSTNQVPNWYQFKNRPLR